MVRQPYEDIRQAFMMNDDAGILAKIGTIAPPADEGEIISLMYVVALELKRRRMPRDGQRRELLAGVVDQIGKSVLSRAAMH
ncbi:MAG: hypothetical protein JNM20_07600 [Rhizobiales bacterium]|nr:hypothetical protein [Hyphomicrobiales bacterium]